MTENGNSWELLLIIVTVSFVLYVTGLLDPTPKCIYTAFTYSRSAKIEKRANIFKVNSKDIRTICVASIVKFEHISHFILQLLLLNLDKKNAAWA